jgi:molybdopterin converting factor small subunit
MQRRKGVTITIRLFGPQAQLAGTRELIVELPDADITCGELRQMLARTQSSLSASLAASRLAVNQAFAADDDPVRAGDEVALIGLISGG